MKKEKIFTDYLYENETKYADLVYLRQPIHGKYHDFTWAEAMQQARKIANFLKQQGFKKGDRIAILSKNCAEWFITDFAIVMAGMVSVPLYAAQHPDIINYILGHSEAKLIFVGKLDNWTLQEPGIPKNIPRVAFPYETMPSTYQWNDLIEHYSPLMENEKPDIDDMYSILYTSGTTGKPKGVVYSFRSLVNYAKGYLHDVDIGNYPLPVYCQFLSYLPLAHVIERLGIEYGSILRKTTVSFVESLATFAKNIEDTSPHVFIAVPRLWVQFQMGIYHKLSQKKLDILLEIPVVSSLIKKKIKKALGLGRATVIISGSAPISPAVIKWYRKLDIEILEGYGMTENLLTCTLNSKKNKDGTVGLPRARVEIKIGKDGEVLSKSDIVMVEYYKDPKATKAAFTKDGYLHTGDKGSIDEAGYLTILGRLKDSFKTDKGEFVNPIPIENRFMHNIHVEQLCLIGLTLPHPVMIVSLSDAARNRGVESVTREVQITLDEINNDLTNFEKISHVFVAKDHWTPENALTTPTLKIKREAVFNRYIEQIREAITKDEKIIWE